MKRTRAEKFSPAAARRPRSAPQPARSALQPAWLAAVGHLGWIACCAALYFASAWMIEHDWEYGRQRSGLILLCGLLVFVLRWPWRAKAAGGAATPGLRYFTSKAMIAIATICLAFGLFEDARVGLESYQHAARTGEIRLDQGQNLFRAATLLRDGEDPYGRGALIDLEAFSTRFRDRAQLGMAPKMRPIILPQAMARYSREPEKALRDQLLPEPAPGLAPEQAREAEREYSLLGHKYGPLPVLLAAPGISWGPKLIPLLQAAAFLGWIAALAWLLFAPALGLPLAAIFFALACVLLEPHVSHDFLFNSASDAWGLAFCALALGAWMRQRPALTGLSIALGLACKMFPAALFVPLLLVRARETKRVELTKTKQVSDDLRAPRSQVSDDLQRQVSDVFPAGAGLASRAQIEPAVQTGPLAALDLRATLRGLAVFALALLALFLPFALWDARGLWLNLVAWPSLMAPDNTGWLAYFPRAAGAARAFLLTLTAIISAVDLLGLRVQRARPFLRFAPVDRRRSAAHFALASALVICAGSAFHNNYVPWVTSWGFAAILIAFA